jgi:hypothetical protein
MYKHGDDRSRDCPGWVASHHPPAHGLHPAAEAVPLGFVHPVGAFGQLGYGRDQHQLHERPLPAAAPSASGFRQ